MCRKTVLLGFSFWSLNQALFWFDIRLLELGRFFVYVGCFFLCDVKPSFHIKILLAVLIILKTCVRVRKQWEKAVRYTKIWNRNSSLTNRQCPWMFRKDVLLSAQNLNLNLIFVAVKSEMDSQRLQCSWNFKINVIRNIPTALSFFQVLFKVIYNILNISTARWQPVPDVCFGYFFYLHEVYKYWFSIHIIDSRWSIILIINVFHVALFPWFSVSSRIFNFYATSTVNWVILFVLKKQTRNLKHYC